MNIDHTGIAWHGRHQFPKTRKTPAMYRIAQLLLGKKVLSCFGSNSNFGHEHRCMKRGHMLVAALAGLAVVIPTAVASLPITATCVRATQLVLLGNTASATVTARHVQHHLRKPGKYRLWQPRNDARVSAYRIEAVYTFQTQDRQRLSGSERFSDSSPSFRLPKGSTIAIRYLPGNPHVSMPEETISVFTHPLVVTSMIIGPFLLLLGALWCIRAIHHVISTESPAEN